jgi:hypothetical protein
VYEEGDARLMWEKFGLALVVTVPVSSVAYLAVDRGV